MHLSLSESTHIRQRQRQTETKERNSKEKKEMEDQGRRKERKERRTERRRRKKVEEEGRGRGGRMKGILWELCLQNSQLVKQLRQFPEKYETQMSEGAASWTGPHHSRHWALPQSLIKLRVSLLCSCASPAVVNDCVTKPRSQSTRMLTSLLSLSF